MLLQDRNAFANHLIDRLPPAMRRHLVGALEPVELELRQVLVRCGEPLRHVYFPTSSSFISQVIPADRGHLEVAIVGSEGMFGVPVALGVEKSNTDAVVQGAGRALRLDSRAFRAELDRSRPLREAVSRYTYVSMTQLARNAVCNRYHVVEQRLARWLLMSADRARSNAFDVTHAFLANMLGVRRVGVTQAARTLQERELIRYTRGRMVIRDRKGLQKAACSCYHADLETYRNVFG
ncbi:MAG TPA: Crp/Fnr family transcriptional regulator [Usitatibacter sp.]|nr:Crp/Fnr family transcriptional regulator [Usitatibacter sp.]